MRGLPSARLIPLAALLTLASTLSALSLVRRRGQNDPASAYAHAPAPADANAADAAAPALTGPPPPKDVPVAPNSARMMHGDARHTHRARGRGPISAKIRWVYKSGGSVQAQVVTSPDEQTLYVASLDGFLTALSRDGAVRFQTPLGGRAYSTPCVAVDGTIYVGSDAKKFFAIAPDGHIVWKLELRSDADTGAAIDRLGRIVFAAGRSVYVVRPRGDVALRFDARAKIFTSPALADNGNVVFGSQDHHLYIFSETGAPLAATDLGADVDGGPAIGDDGAIFVGTDAGEIVRLDANGTIQSRISVGGFVRGTLSVSRNGDVLAGVYGPMPRQVRVAADGRNVRGSFFISGTGAPEFGVHGGALEDEEGTLYFGAQDDAAYAIDRAGQIVFRYTAGGDVDAPLTLLSDGSLVVPSDDGTVTLLAP